MKIALTSRTWMILLAVVLVMAFALVVTPSVYAGGDDEDDEGEEGDGADPLTSSCTNYCTSTVPRWFMEVRRTPDISGCIVYRVLKKKHFVGREPYPICKCIYGPWQEVGRHCDQLATEEPPLVASITNFLRSLRMEARQEDWYWYEE